jgi:hypothetical protein
MKQGTVLLKEYAQTWKESENLTGQLLIALCNLSLEHPEQARRGFIPIDITDAVTTIIGRTWVPVNDPSACSDKVRRYWNQLVDLWITKQDGIHQYFSDNDIHVFPKLKKIEGGGTGNPSRYFIAWSENPSPINTKQIADNAYVMHQIKYVCEDIQNPGLLARIFAKGMDISGWRRYLFALFISVPIIMGTLAFFLLLAQVVLWDSFGTERIFRTAISISLFLLSIWITAGSFINLPDKRIVLAPIWIQSEWNDRLIEIQKQPTKTIKAVHYSSTCPICQGKINAVSGKLEFWGRIVGRCENAPTEHVFSFDHVTRSGKSLRS